MMKSDNDDAHRHQDNPAGDASPTGEANTEPPITPVGDGAYPAWKASEERKTAKRVRTNALRIAFATFLAGAVLAMTAVTRSAHGTYRIHAVPLIAGGTLALISAGLVAVFWWRYSTAKSEFLEDWRRERIYDAMHGITPEDVRQLIVLNQRRMDQYHQMTLSQAAVAWRSSQLAMTAGLLVLIAGVIVALVAASTATAQVVIGSLAGIGSALSGYVAATFLQARRQSLSQLNYYFHQPLTTSYLLTAERLADKLDSDDAATHQMWNDLVTRIADHAFDTPQDPAADPSADTHA